jgi:hypothetical protein
MRAAIRNIEFTEGDDYPHVLTYSSGLDVSGWTFAAQVRPTTTSDESWSFTFDLSNAATGVVAFSLTAEQTAEMPTQCVWDFHAFDETGSRRTQLRGDVKVQRQVTQDA